MPRSNVLIVVVDGLRASALGHTAIPRSRRRARPIRGRQPPLRLVLWCLPSILRPSTNPCGGHSIRWCFANAGETAGTAVGINAIVPARINESGYRTTLVSDDPNIASFDGANAFQNVVNVIGAGNMAAAKRAKDIHETELSRLFAAASDVASDSFEEADTAHDEAQPYFIWVHARGMYGAWDAPLELHEALIDENDPPPIEDVTTPDVAMERNGDPDVAFRYACGYAGQIMMLDACWQACSLSRTPRCGSQPRTTSSGSSGTSPPPLGACCGCWRGRSIRTKHSWTTCSSSTSRDGWRSGCSRWPHPPSKTCPRRPAIAAVTHADLASLCGGSRENVTRVLSEFQTAVPCWNGTGNATS